MPINGSAAVVLIAAVLAVDLWVYLDARARQAQGVSVDARVGPVEFRTAEQWLLGCILLWVVVVPLYLTARRA